MHLNYLKLFINNKAARLGMALLGTVLLAALLGPHLVPHDPWQYSGHVLQAPCERHWLGTNDVGQDIFSQLVYGARTSMAVAFGVALLSTLTALVLGSATAMVGGRCDTVFMRITDAMLSIPPVLIIILAAAYLRPGIPSLILLLVAVGWPAGARIVRAQVLTLKERTHVYAAYTFGSGPLAVFIKHLLPDLGPVAAAGFIQGARRAVLTEAGLSFLGITSPGLISWGSIIYQAVNFSYLGVWKWWLLPACAALSVTVLAITYLAYGMEAVLDRPLGVQGREV
ncbi:ABC transporter permease [Desulfofalx alkaliphila]|uniref:ABC transporter permease n=1 Tax=Desulfofalx alkaliphila TaxID=105483 RepID=UPI0004E1168D|nr:ABC transporter permease [Desulfofalx alkaliphila]